ncbi:hypothetical protein D3C80_1544090 [compost metagenome]
MAAKLSACRVCKGHSAHSGGEKAISVQRTTAALAPTDSVSHGPTPTRRRHGSTTHMKPISTTTEKAHSRPVMLSGIPCAFQAMAENP